MSTAGRIARIIVLLTLAGVVAVPAVAPGQKRPKPPRGSAALTLDARPSTIVFGQASRISGRLTGTSTTANVVVRLEADDTRPYGDSYHRTGAETRTANNGTYGFDVRPAQNTQYRAVAETSPPVTSGARLVLVRWRVGLIVSDLTPSRGERVRFRGSVAPQNDGAAALIQRRSATGRFVTVATTTLKDAGDARSVYSRRLRIRSDGVYRVKVRGDANHINGYSRTRRLDVHG